MSIDHLVISGGGHNILPMFGAVKFLVEKEYINFSNINVKPTPGYFKFIHKNFYFGIILFFFTENTCILLNISLNTNI